jgi:hypothetical protein
LGSKHFGAPQGCQPILLKDECWFLLVAHIAPNGCCLVY